VNISHLTKKEENGFLVLNYGILLEKRTKEFDVKTFTVAEGSDQDQIAPSEGMINEKREKNCKMSCEYHHMAKNKKVPCLNWLRFLFGCLI
jgi:hypothetical protein